MASAQVAYTHKLLKLDEQEQPEKPELVLHKALQKCQLRFCVSNYLPTELMCISSTAGSCRAESFELCGYINFFFFLDESIFSEQVSFMILVNILTRYFFLWSNLILETDFSSV